MILSISLITHLNDGSILLLYSSQPFGLLSFLLYSSYFLQNLQDSTIADISSKIPSYLRRNLLRYREIGSSKHDCGDRGLPPDTPSHRERGKTRIKEVRFGTVDVCRRMDDETDDV
ncbi:hypothetical protein EVAR_36848_1 [Eumeta japonica]|uniref:Uncharacterized protein n=1 Tax=Eumeta variegata TaxID=151549 RepID=A0A4C1WE13_EUMVA|nr:hypothetical protein EVAR_36848_1 [Eumeta japonica]